MPPVPGPTRNGVHQDSKPLPVTDKVKVSDPSVPLRTGVAPDTSRGGAGLGEKPPCVRVAHLEASL